jgi:hypothetical protein
MTSECRLIEAVYLIHLSSEIKGKNIDNGIRAAEAQALVLYQLVKSMFQNNISQICTRGSECHK